MSGTQVRGTTRTALSLARRIPDGNPALGQPDVSIACIWRCEEFAIVDRLLGWTGYGWARTLVRSKFLRLYYLNVVNCRPSRSSSGPSSGRVASGLLLAIT